MYKFLLAHSTDHGWKVKSTNLFQVAKPKTTVEETTGTNYSREKPINLSSYLIKLFAKPKTWGMDVFSGCGKWEQCLRFEYSFCVIYLQIAIGKKGNVKFSIFSLLN